MKNEKRRHYREKMVAEVSYKDEKKQTFGGCITKDISESGVCIVIREFIPLGNILELQFKLPLSLSTFYIKGKIVRINKTPYNEQWEVGVELMPDTNYSKLVKNYITIKTPKKFESKFLK